MPLSRSIFIATISLVVVASIVAAQTATQILRPRLVQQDRKAAAGRLRESLGSSRVLSAIIEANHLLKDGELVSVSLSVKLNQVFIAADESDGGGFTVPEPGMTVLDALHHYRQVFGGEVNDPDQYGVLAVSVEGTAADILAAQQAMPNVQLVVLKETGSRELLRQLDLLRRGLREVYVPGESKGKDLNLRGPPGSTFIKQSMQTLKAAENSRFKPSMGSLTIAPFPDDDERRQIVGTFLWNSEADLSGFQPLDAFEIQTLFQNKAENPCLKELVPGVCGICKWELYVGDKIDFYASWKHRYYDTPALNCQENPLQDDRTVGCFRPAEVFKAGEQHQYRIITSKGQVEASAAGFSVQRVERAWDACDFDPWCVGLNEKGETQFIFHSSDLVVPTPPVGRSWGGFIMSFKPGQGAYNEATWVQAFRRAEFDTFVISPTDNPVHRWEMGCTQDFQGTTPGVHEALMQANCSGDIYQIYGGMWDKFIVAGGPSALGYPSTDRQHSTSGATGLTVDWQAFRKGLDEFSLTLHADSRSPRYRNAYLVQGAIFQLWKSLGYERSWLGAPISDEYTGQSESIGSRPYMIRRSDFEGGYILWREYTNLTEAFHPVAPLSATCSASPFQAQANQTVTFSVAVSGGTLPYRYAWSSAITGTAASIAASFSVPGTYTAYVTAIDSGSPQQTSNSSCQVRVLPQNQPPRAGFTLSAAGQLATEGQNLNLTVLPGGIANVAFTANRSSDSDGRVVAWQWRINGTVVSTANGFTFGLGAGNHVVALVVWDDAGAQSPPVQGGIVVTTAAAGGVLAVGDIVEMVQVGIGVKQGERGTVVCLFPESDQIPVDVLVDFEKDVGGYSGLLSCCGKARPGHGFAAKKEWVKKLPGRGTVPPPTGETCSPPGTPPPRP